MWQNSIGELTAGIDEETVEETEEIGLLLVLVDFLQDEREEGTGEKGREEGRMTCGGLLEEKEGA
jgi:hypothetical protein